MLRSGARSMTSLALLVMLCGCSLTSEVPLADCELGRNNVVPKIDLFEFVNTSMQGICDDAASWARDPPVPVLVPDVVDIQTLEPGSLGISLGELIRTKTLNYCKVPVRQVEASQQVRLNETGLTILSRNLQGGQSKTLAGDMAIIGTYTIERGRLTLTLRRLRMEDSTIEAIRSTSVSWACMKPPFRRPKFQQQITSG